MKCCVVGKNQRVRPHLLGNLCQPPAVLLPLLPHPQAAVSAALAAAASAVLSLLTSVPRLQQQGPEATGRTADVQQQNCGGPLALLHRCHAVICVPCSACEPSGKRILQCAADPAAALHSRLPGAAWLMPPCVEGLFKATAYSSCASSGESSAASHSNRLQRHCCASCTPHKLGTVPDGGAQDSFY